MSRFKRQPREDHWVSISDIMTGLMVIFMFIAISYILQAQQRQAERDELFEEFKAVKQELYQELDSAFRDDFVEWQVELDKDLSIKFTNPDILFLSGSSRLTPKFQEILDQFIPRYLAIILQEKYAGKISEVRIEGHTDETPYYRHPDPYIGNVMLSQARSTEVLAHLRKQSAYNQLVEAQKETLRFWLTANGLSYGRTLDENKELTATSGLEADNTLSRRVEFRIITSSEQLVERVIKELENE